jgi:RNA polymerase sigma-70 factor (ECF subfamily)
VDDERGLIDRALDGDAEGARLLVRLLMPVVHARAARMLVRRRGGSGRDVRQDVEDVAQEVFSALFEDGGRILRLWDPSRGLSLASYVGLIAEREVASILRSGKRSPWKETATDLDDLDRELGHVADAEPRIASREQLARLMDRLQEALSPRGLELFHRLIVEEEAVENVCKTTGMTSDAVYAWKSRLAKTVRKLAADVAKSDPAVVVSDSAASPRRSRQETS